MVPIGAADPVLKLMRSPPVKSAVKHVKSFVENTNYGVFPIADPSHSTKIRNILKQALGLLFVFGSCQRLAQLGASIVFPNWVKIEMHLIMARGGLLGYKIWPRQSLQ